jgi:hypothetical protein
MLNLLRVSTAAAALLVAVPTFAQNTVIVQRPATIELSPDQRTVIQRHIVRERTVHLPARVELRVGAVVPAGVEVYSFPEEVYVEVPVLKRYRYVHVSNEIVLIDPDTNEIVEILR